MAVTVWLMTTEPMSVAAVKECVVHPHTLKDCVASLLGNDFFTQVELAHELGIHQRTLARMEANRIGPPKIKLGKKVLYSRKSVLAWIASLEQTPPRSGRSVKTRKVAA